MLTGFSIVFLYAIILYKLCTLSISITAQKEFNKSELLLPSIQLVTESIGALAHSDELELWELGRVCVHFSVCQHDRELNSGWKQLL